MPYIFFFSFIRGEVSFCFWFWKMLMIVTRRVTFSRKICHGVMYLGRFCRRKTHKNADFKRVYRVNHDIQFFIGAKAKIGYRI